MPKKHVTETRKLDAWMTRADVVADSFDKEKRTFDVVWSMGSKGVRYDWRTEQYFMEELSMDPKSVRMQRLSSGRSPFLDNHESYGGSRSVKGVIESASVDGVRGVARIRLADTPDTADLARKIETKILPNISVGYKVHRYEKLPMQEGDKYPTWKATDWEPMEISSVPVGFDENAVVRGNDKEAGTPCVFVSETEETEVIEPKEVRNMPPEITNPNPSAPVITSADIDNAKKEAIAQARAAEKNRQDQIRSMVVTHKLDAAFEKKLIDSDASVESAREAVLSELAKRSAEIVTAPGVHVTGGAPSLLAERKVGMETFLMHRANPGEVKVTESAREFVGMSLLEMARHMLEAGGVSTRGMNKMDIATRAFHSTSDFPNILANVANKTLRKGYEESPRTFIPWAKRSSMPDFKSVSRNILGEAPNLEKVLEGGEIKRGTIGEGKEAYNLATYAKIIAISRNVIINDDLQAFANIPSRFGAAAARLESDIVYAILTANANLADGTALFATSVPLRNANLKSSGGSAPDVTSLGLARQVMRTQKGLNGDDTLNLMMKFLIAPAALETKIDQLLQSITPALTSSVVPQAIKSLIPIIEPRLDANSATAWYGAADSSQVDTVEYGYLEGQEGVYTEVRQGFDVDGMEIKARLDFAAKAIDFRGLYKNVGA